MPLPNFTIFVSIPIISGKRVFAVSTNKKNASGFSSSSMARVFEISNVSNEHCAEPMAEHSLNESFLIESTTVAYAKSSTDDNISTAS